MATLVQHCNLSAATVYIYMLRTDRKDIWIYYDASFVKVFFILLLISNPAFISVIYVLFICYV